MVYLWVCFTTGSDRVTITFGVVGVINMAHGELIMIGAYCADIVQQIIPNNSSISILLAIPTAFLFTGYWNNSWLWWLKIYMDIRDYFRYFWH